MAGLEAAAGAPVVTVVDTSANDSVAGPVGCSVSAVVVNYNAGSLILDCVRLALRQCDEVVVVDNASADDSLTLLESAIAGGRQ